MFNTDNNRPLSEGVFFSDPNIKESNLLQAYRRVGNLAEFGMYACGGLFLAFLCRITGGIIFYALLLLCVWGWLYISKKQENQQEISLIGLAALAATTAAFWDVAWFVLSLFWVRIALALVLSLSLAITLFIRLRRNRA